ncbi:MAG: hypothetical protein ACKO83_14650, partial [Roseiflexaceae bacterium]
SARPQNCHAWAQIYRYGIKNTSACGAERIKIPLEGAFLAQGRINAPPYQQCAASIGVGIVIIHNSIMR